MKTFVGPRLRLLRREHGHTQAEMADRLGVSAAYINLIEHNQRSLSVRVLIGLLEHYGVDWQDILSEGEDRMLGDLRSALGDPIFAENHLDARELQAAVESAPNLASNFIKLYADYRQMVETMMRRGSEGMPSDLLSTSSEAVIHDFFRDNLNYFPTIENAAGRLVAEMPQEVEARYAFMRNRLLKQHGIAVRILPVEDMDEVFRIYDSAAKTISLSEAFDSINRTFQLAHLLCFFEQEKLLDDITSRLQDRRPQVINRCRVELANYFAAAVLMPYQAFLSLAEATAYDIDRLAARFGVSVEQVCHRLTTLQKEGERGIPFFFLRVDKAGNVTKRFNATSFQIAQYGGSCPVWNMHTAFRMPGVIIPQFVELPEGERFFTLSRTTERPAFSHETQDRRLVISLGCSIEHAEKIAYARPLALGDKRAFAKIGINCHLCPREGCSQRAHQPLIMELKVDPARRGNTRYDA